MQEVSMLNRISPDILLASMGVTPADNVEGLEKTVPWKSKVAGVQVRGAFIYHHILDFLGENPQLYGPISFAAKIQKTFMDCFISAPIKAYARMAAHTGRNPNIFSELNAWIYQNYASLLHDLCTHVMKDGRFDRHKAAWLSSSLEGQALLRKYMYEFAFLEYNYSSVGLTRLKAMKDLLKCILIAVTEKPLESEDLPFVERAMNRDPASFSEYLQESRIRIENLYRENAFDIMKFSERATEGKLGYSAYEIVEGSKMYSVTLRHYMLPKGIPSNGKVLYLATPLINKPEIYDFGKGKSVIEGLLKEGYDIYLVDYGEAGPEEAEVGLAFFGKTVHDRYLDIIQERHPGREIDVMAYCMAGTLMLAYLARRAEERRARGEAMDIKKIALMASPVLFDDGDSGHGPMREMIRMNYDAVLMNELFGDVNILPQIIEAGMNEIQPGVQYTVPAGFYGRASHPDAIQDAAPFIYWLTHGTSFPAKAHREWIEKFFLGNQLVEGKYCLPSANPDLDGKPVNMNILREVGVIIFNYRGTRDPIAPVGSCVAGQLWGQVEDKNISVTRGGLNRTIEKNIGHIFVVSKKLLSEYLDIVSTFFRGEVSEGE